MNHLPRILLVLIFGGASLHAGELDQIARNFITATSKNDATLLAEVFVDSPPKDKAIAEIAQVPPLLEAGQLQITAVDKELIIGDLGGTLMRLDFEGQPKPSFRPIGCVRTEGKWKIFPCASTSDLKVLAEMRTPEEKIHIQLFNKWASLMEDLLLEQDSGGEGDRSEK
jgi:hypothetical protein